MYRLLFNPLARNARGEESLREVIELINSEHVSYSLLEHGDLKELFETFNLEDQVVVIGGDGTLHRFINTKYDPSYDIYFYAGGTGNDFMREYEDRLVPLSSMKDRPYVETDGKDYVMNGYASGVDSEVLRMYNNSKNHSNFAYFYFAIKAILTYKPRNIEVMIDGEHHSFQKNYLIAVQNGTAFGGGMKITPHAKHNDGLLDVCIVHNISRLKLLTIFPKVYLGTHLKHKKHVFYAQGKEVEIQFETPNIYSADGELNETPTKRMKISL